METTTVTIGACAVLCLLSCAFGVFLGWWLCSEFYVASRRDEERQQRLTAIEGKDRAARSGRDGYEPGCQYCGRFLDEDDWCKHCGSYTP